MILDAIADTARLRVLDARKRCPLEEIKEKALALPKGNFVFEKVIRIPEMAFICEVKKASPSKGVIASNFPYTEIARDYELAGASAISVLTEPDYFMGRNQYLTEIRRAVQIPLLRKDFTVDEYQLYEAKLIGADAVLLICSLLDTETLSSYIDICNQLGISALVEAHTKEEVLSARAAGARIIGINNRNLKTFEVDFNNSIQLRSLVPPEILFVAESGIRTAADIHVLYGAGVNAVLIGETLMRSVNKRVELDHLRSGCYTS